MDERHHVEIRYAPDCPLVEHVRTTLNQALERTSADVEITEVVGEHPSPTLTVDGWDVTGRPLGGTRCCRLDLPFENDVLAALHH